MFIGERIRTARKNKKLTQKQLAEILNVATGTIQQYELGKRTPRFEQVIALSDALEVSVPYLYNYPGFETLEKATKGYSSSQKRQTAFAVFMQLLQAMYGKCEERGMRAEYDGKYLRTEMFYLYENSGNPVALLEDDANIVFDVMFDTVESLVRNLSTTEEDATTTIKMNTEQLCAIDKQRALEKAASPKIETPTK